MVKIKILYTIPNFDTAGSGKVLYDLTKNLNPEIFEVHIACHHSNGSFFKEVKKLGIPIHLITTTQPLRPYFTLFKRIRPFTLFIKMNQFNIVHSWHWSSDWSEVLAVRMSSAKYIYTKKAMSWGNVHWKIKSFLADFIITINQDMRAFFPSKKEQVLIPLGLDVNYYSPEDYPKRKASNFFKIITVANLVPVKGIEVLIRAVHQLNDGRIQLEILGDDRDGYADELKALVHTLGLQEQIAFLGKQLDVRPYIHQADLYVIPTLDSGRKEGMPMALVEAMAMGVTVLGSNISGINYVLRDFPHLLIEAGNMEQLSKAIQHWMNTSREEREVQGSALRVYCQEHYSIEQSIRAHEELYQKMIKR
jgi:glycosyltransferase involved in cell wall biosynthesis